MAIFLAGNRQIDKTLLENVLVLGINPYIETYQGVWGRENTDAVRQAYSLLINAIHDDKVSMNIDGSLNIKDGSIVNSPNKKGFDPVAKAAYFITDIINRIPEYKEPEPEPEPKKTYDTDTFARNFASYLAPPGSNVNIGEVWANLDDEIEDKEGNRTRPYTNRLAAFNTFLDQEIKNLDSYNDFNEYWGDKETLRARLLDLKSRLADGNISKLDMLELSRMGFRADYFDLTGTPLTEEEKATILALKALAELKLQEETTQLEQQSKANAGVLNIITGVNEKDVSKDLKKYSHYLASTYGRGEEAFNNINTKILELLGKAYTTGNLSPEEKRQLGNFLYYIKTNNPTYKDLKVSLEELNELKTHKNFISKDVFRLPWQTSDGRYIYADNKGTVYFLKPKNNIKYRNYATTPYSYKRDFLKKEYNDLELYGKLGQSALLGSVIPGVGNTLPFVKKEDVMYGIEDAIIPGSGTITRIGSNWIKKKLGLLKNGGNILKLLFGGVTYDNNTSWYTNVFLPNLQHIISELTINGSKYAKWINSMQGRHSNLYNQAKAGDFLKTPWTHKDVGTYLFDYKNDPLAFYKLGNEKGTIIGYNSGIDSAIKNNRYVIASKNPTSGDWNTLDYTVDSRYSGITDDRRILGRENDFTEELLKDLNNKLAKVKHFAYLDKDNYYKLGYIDDNGIKKIYDGDTPYMDLDKMLPIDILGTVAGTNPDLSKLPTEIHIGDSSSVRPEGTELNPFKQDTVGIIQEGLLNGLKVGLLLANIRATNANYRDLRNGLNLYRPSDYTLNYHQVMDDYAGNLFVAATAAKLQNNLVPISSDKNFNEARALERELKAAELMHLLAVLNLKTIQLHVDLAEKYGNANREARVNTANENSKMFFNLAMLDALAKLLRRAANMTSLNNFWSDEITNFENKINERKELMDAWKADRLGDRTAWIKNKVLTDSTYQKLVEEYKVAKQNKDTKRQQELVPLITLAQRDAINKAGAEWDQLYALVYNLPYYTFTPRYRLWVEGLRVATPTYHKRGGRISDETEIEREKLRIMRANDDRFMRSIWKAIDLYIQQIKNK